MKNNHYFTDYSVSSGELVGVSQCYITPPPPQVTMRCLGPSRSCLGVALVPYFRAFAVAIHRLITLSRGFSRNLILCLTCVG